MLAAEGASRRELGRAGFEDRVWAWKREYGGFITGQLRRLGASCDWSRERFTLDEQLSGEGFRVWGLGTYCEWSRRFMLDEQLSGCAGWTVHSARHGHHCA